MKTCSKCKEPKPLTDYTKDKYRKDGLTNYCAPCRRVIVRAKKVRAYGRPDYRAKRLLTNAQHRARKRGVPFTATVERVRSAIERGLCEATGLPFDLSVYGEGRVPFSPSLDRIEPDLGYTDENIQVVVTIHNLARNDFGDDALERWARAYIDQCK